MAGIGFELKKLFKKEGVLSILKAYGYTGMITAGPMLLGIGLLLGIVYIGKANGLSEHAGDLLVSMITYALLGSLILTSVFSMINTRYLADMIYEGKENRILSSLLGVLAIELPVGAAVCIVFLMFAGIGLSLMVLFFTLFMELIVSFTAMSYMTAVKSYKEILISYVFAATGAFATAFILSLIFKPATTLLLFSAVVGYGVMMVEDIRILYRYFKVSRGHYFDFMSYFKKYGTLAVISFMMNIGLFSHLVIAWSGSIGRKIYGLFYAAPQHDIAALFAFLTILMTTINFVASVEVNFYPKYRRYYDLFNTNGSILEIEQAEKEMLTVLWHELSYTARRQFYFTALMMSIGLAVLNTLPLGFDSLMGGYFRILCVGYGAYAVGNVLMLILLYFTDYKGAKWAAVSFAIISTGVSLVSLSFKAKYYGFGFTVGAMVYFLICYVELRRFTSKLQYHILSTQPLVSGKE